MKKLLDLPISVYIGWALRILSWLAVPGLGFLAWYRLRDPDDVLVAAIEDWFVLVLIVIATVLAKYDLGVKLLSYNRRDELEEDSSLALEESLRTYVKERKSQDRDNRVRELLLRAVERAVKLELSLSVSDKVKANLLLLEIDGDHSEPTHVIVAARSQPGSPTPKKYAVNVELPAYKAMQENTTVIFAGADLRAEDNRLYKSVVATPIAIDEKSYGAITLDSQRKDAFRGKEVEIDRILRPFAAQMLLTIQLTNPSYSCPERYSR